MNIRWCTHLIWNDQFRTSVHHHCQTPELVTVGRFDVKMMTSPDVLFCTPHMVPVGLTITVQTSTFFHFSCVRLHIRFIKNPVFKSCRHLPMFLKNVDKSWCNNQIYYPRGDNNDPPYWRRWERTPLLVRMTRQGELTSPGGSLLENRGLITWDQRLTSYGRKYPQKRLLIFVEMSVRGHITSPCPRKQPYVNLFLSITVNRIYLKTYLLNSPSTLAALLKQIIARKLNSHGKRKKQKAKFASHWLTSIEHNFHCIASFYSSPSALQWNYLFP